VAHLIKLEDYVSRYQYDMYRYPSQFSRLKRERWKRLKQEWETSYLEDTPSVEKFVEQQQQTVKGAFKKLKNWYKKDKSEVYYDNFEESTYQFKYKTLPELKVNFIKELYEFQLNWASSTILEKSQMKNMYFYDIALKWLLQSLPDNYFLMYYPTITYPKAKTQFDILLIGPTDIWCIVNLRGKHNTIFQTSTERYWLEVNGDEETKIINPLLSLNRMSTIIKRILADIGLDIPVEKAVLSQEGYIDVEAPWSSTQFLDQRGCRTWSEKLKKNSSPIKSNQLKFAQALLNVCQTTSVTRSDYEDSDRISLDYDD
jgi:hypothetical protein